MKFKIHSVVNHRRWGRGLVTHVREKTEGGSNINMEVKTGRAFVTQTEKRDEVCVMFPDTGDWSWCDSKELTAM